MDPDIIQQLNDQLREMAAIANQQNAVLAAQLRALESVSNATKAHTNATNNLKNAENADSNVVTGNTAKTIAATRATEMVDNANRQFAKSIRDGKDVLLGFASTVVDATPGMTKYAGSVKGATSAIGGIASVFGPLGKVAQLLLGAVGELAGSALKYSDAVVEGYDAFAKAGAGIGNSAEGIMDLAHKAGLSSGNLTLLTKNIQALGPNLRNLGNSTSEGAETFSRMIAVGDKNLQKYRKLGYTQERLIESQAKYVELQAQAGANMRKSPEELQKGSLAYIDNLNKLSELTGLNEKKQQELLEQAQAQENFNAYITGLEADKEAALKRGDQAKADEIDKVIQVKKNYAMFAEQFGPEKAKAILETISSNEDPTITDSNADIVRGMPELLDQARKLNRGFDQVPELIEANGRSVDHFAAMSGDQATSMGEASRERMKRYGQDNQSREMNAKYRNMTAAQLRDEGNRLRKEQEDKKNQDKGIMAQRAAIESQERALRQTFDVIMAKLSSKLNDMILKFIPMVTKAFAFVVNHSKEIEIAAKVLGAAFLAMAGIAGVGKIVNTVRSIGQGFKSLFGKKDTATYITLDSGPTAGGPAGIAGELLGSVTSSIPGMGAVTDALDQPSGQDGAIGGIVDALKSASRDAGAIIKGGAALGTGLALIGGGAAAAIWIVGKAIPTFTEGLKSFNNVNGENLKGVGIGMLGITGGIILAATGGVLAGFLSLFSDSNPLQGAADALIEFQKQPIDAERVKENGEAAIAFSEAIAGATTIGAFSKVADSISDFFSKKPPYKDFEDFAKLKIDAKKVKNNAIAFKYFSEAMASYNGSMSVGDVTTALANAVIKHFAIPLPLVEFQYFSRQDINPDRARKNSLSFKYFSEAMASYKGSDQGVLDALSQLIGSKIAVMFDPKGPVQSFIDFTNAPFGPNGPKNSKAFLQFAQALGMLTGGSGESTLGQVGSGLINAAANIGGSALGFIGGTVTAIGGLLGKIIKAESGGKADAAAKTSSAYGLGQFTKGTFEGIARQKGSPVFGVSWEEYKRNPNVQMKALEFLVKQNQDFLRKSNIPVDDASTYLAHFLGPGGVRNIYRHADSEPLTQVVGSAAYNANRSVFDKAKTVGGLKAWASKKMGGPGLQARKGGLFTGPKSGYPMELHGTEMVVPLDQNSVLKSLSQKTAATTEDMLSDVMDHLANPTANPAIQQSSPTDRIIEIDNQMREMLLVKINRMLNVLDDRHSVAKKILRHVT